MSLVMRVLFPASQLAKTITCISIGLTSACQTPYQLPQPLLDSYDVVISQWRGLQQPIEGAYSFKAGHNVVVNNCNLYPGGNAQLLLDFSHAVSSGLSCLTKWGRKSDAERLSAIFDDRIEQRPFQIFCEQAGPEKLNGFAFESTSAKFPGMAIILSSNFHKGKSRDLRSGFLFHELTHSLGYYHLEHFDLPELAELCCFEEKKSEPASDSVGNPACTLLRDNPAFGSVQYIRRLADRNLGARKDLAMQTALKASIDQSDGLLLGVATVEIFDHATDPYLGIIFGHVASNSTRDKHTKFQEELQAKQLDRHLSQYDSWPHAKAMAELTGDALAAMIRSDWDSADRNMTALRIRAKSDCTHLNAAQKSDLNKAFGLIGIGVYEKGQAPPYLWENWLRSPVC